MTIILDLGKAGSLKRDGAASLVGMNADQIGEGESDKRVRGLH
jgi:hypothetical protein